MHVSLLAIVLREYLETQYYIIIIFLFFLFIFNYKENSKEISRNVVNNNTVPLVYVNRQIIVIRWSSSLPPTEYNIVLNGRVKKRRYHLIRGNGTPKVRDLCNHTTKHTQKIKWREKYKRTGHLINNLQCTLGFQIYNAHNTYTIRTTDTWEENKNTISAHSHSLLKYSAQVARSSFRAGVSAAEGWESMG